MLCSGVGEVCHRWTEAVSRKTIERSRPKSLRRTEMACSRICSVSGFQSSSNEWVDIDQLSNQLLTLLMNAGMVGWSRKDALYRTKYLLRNSAMLPQPCQRE